MCMMVGGGSGGVPSACNFVCPLNVDAPPGCEPAVKVKGHNGTGG